MMVGRVCRPSLSLSSDNAHSSELSNVMHGRCARSAGSNRQIQASQTDKAR